MSKPVKEMVVRELTQRFEGLHSLAVVDVTGVDAVDTRRIRGRLRDKDIRLMVVKNSLARQAFRNAGLDQAAPLFEGPCAVAYGGDSVVTVVRELADIRKETPAVGLKAAVMEGDVFGPDRVEELSQFPTREEAVAKVVSAALSGGGNLAAAMRGPSAALAGILKKIEQNQGGPETTQAA